MRQQHRGQHVALEVRAPLVAEAFEVVRRVRREVAAGVVHERVDWPLGRDALRGGRDRCRLPEVGADRLDACVAELGVQLRSGAREHLLAPAEHEDAVAVGRERAGDRSADPGPAAGDDCDASHPRIQHAPRERRQAA